MLPALLFLATAFTTTTLGAVWFVITRTDMTWELLQFLSPEVIRRVWSNPTLLRDGLQFSLATLAILGTHELGHYLVCRRYGIAATPPFFLPAPFGFGTLGAFIRIRGPLRSRRELFDMAVAGPLAGFAVLLPFLALGSAASTYEVVAAAAPPSEDFFGSYLLVPGHSLILKASLWLFHGPAPVNAVLNFHPFALAAWVGLFATALNLLPLAQLDGGHLLYSVLGPAQRRWAVPLWGGLALLSFVWPGWGLWAAITLAIGLRHPPVHDETPLDRRRLWLAGLALALLLLSFAPVPLSSLALP
jgi:membrane-associated protease RseP (regulator of RpoE activity)